MSNKNFFDININQALSLEIFHFDNFYNNIDWLCKQALHNVSLEQKLAYFTKAANLCEKFHSYFHFEQSFFHLTLAEAFLRKGEINKAALNYEYSIFQDHLNKLAHIRLGECYKDLKQSEKLEAHCGYAQRLNINILETKDIAPYTRVYNNFISYLKFATQSQFLNSLIADKDLQLITPYDYYLSKQILPPNADNLWLGWLKYSLTQDITDLEETINLTKKSHDLYHQNAGKIYYNRALVYQYLNQLELSNNDMIKAQNLWPQINVA